MRVLVIGSDVSLCETVIQARLRSAGHLVAVAGKAERAIQILGDVAPDVIILEATVPDALVQRFRAEQRANPRWAQIPTIEITRTELDQGTPRARGPQR